MADNYYDYDADLLNVSSLCPIWAPVLGFGGCVAAVVFASEFLIRWETSVPCQGVITILP
jgi:hypothetical protein